MHSGIHRHLWIKKHENADSLTLVLVPSTRQTWLSIPLIGSIVYCPTQNFTGLGKRRPENRDWVIIIKKKRTTSPGTRARTHTHTQRACIAFAILREKTVFCRQSIRREGVTHQTQKRRFKIIYCSFPDNIGSCCFSYTV